MEYKEMYETILKDLDDVFSRIDVSTVKQIVEKIHSADRVFLMGVGREGLATRAFAMRLMHLGKQVHWCWDDTTPAVYKNDLFIFTSGSGEIGHIHYVAGEIKKTGASIVLVTGVPDGKTAALADTVLWIPASVFHGKGDLVPSIQPMGSLFEQALFILYDIIILLYSQQYGISFDSMVSRHRNFE